MEGASSSEEDRLFGADPTRQASADAPTESELLALAAEDDGTLAGEDAAERQRTKDENWAVYTEANPRGAGNRMNRG